MNEAISDFLDRIRDNLVSVIAVFLMVVILIGYLVFAATSILPKWRLRGDLLTRVATAEETLNQSAQTQLTSVETLKTQIDSAPIQLTNAADFLMTEAQANQFLNNLYQHASLSNVEIAELQTQSIPSSGTENLYNIKQFQVRVNGELDQLVAFLTRLETASQPGYILNDMVISQGEPQDSLSMKILLYTSLYASADSLASSDLIADTNLNDEANTNTPPPVEEPPPVLYIVRSGDTLLSISQQFNISIAAIRQANNLDGNAVVANQELLLPR